MEKGTEKIPTEKKVTKTNEASEKLVKNGADKLNITQLGSGEENLDLGGRLGCPLGGGRKKSMRVYLLDGWTFK